MKKTLIAATLIAAGIAAAPASAQVYGTPYGGNYGAPYGHAYGYNNYGYGQQQQALQMRLRQIRNDIRQLDRQNMLSKKEARRLDQQARQLQFRVDRAGYNGIDPYERQRLEGDVIRLQQRIQREVADGNRRYGYGNRYAYGQPNYGNPYANQWSRGEHREKAGDHDDDDRDDDDHRGGRRDRD